MISASVKSINPGALKITKSTDRDTPDLKAVGVQVVVRKIEQCFRVIEQVHQRFRILKNTYADSNPGPKPSGFYSVQTILIASNDQLVDLRVQTPAMAASYSSAGVMGSGR